MPRQIAVFGSFLTPQDSAEYSMAEELGYLLARQGLEVLCGGHGGIANPLADGVARGQGRIRGVSLVATRYPQRKTRMNPLIAETAPVRSLGERLDQFAAADGFVFFTGGIGTLSEFAYLWHALQLDAAFDRPLVLLGSGWNKILAQIRTEQMIKHKYYRLLHLCERAADAVAVVANDYSLKYTAAEQRPNRRTLLFELDGVLVESPEESFVRACENLGRFFPMGAVLAAFRQSGGYPPASGTTRPFFSAVLRQLGSDRSTLIEIAEAVSQSYARIPPLYDDAREILEYCRQQGFVTGVLSKRPLPELQGILAAYDLSDMIARAWSQPAQSGSELVRGADGLLQTDGGLPREIVYVGDRRREIRPEHAIRTILLDRHLNHIGQDALVGIRSLRELPFLLQRPVPVVS